MFSLLRQHTTLKSIRLSSRLYSTFSTFNPNYVHVINVPESEFAFNSFFSLHRPLLGLSGEQEFFAVQRTPEEELSEELNEYMMQLEAFAPPSPIKKNE